MHSGKKKRFYGSSLLLLFLIRNDEVYRVNITLCANNTSIVSVSSYPCRYSKVTCEANKILVSARDECQCQPWYVNRANSSLYVDSTPSETCDLRGTFCYDGKVQEGKVSGGSRCLPACDSIRFVAKRFITVL